MDRSNPVQGFPHRYERLLDDIGKLHDGARFVRDCNRDSDFGWLVSEVGVVFDRYTGVSK